MGGWSERSAVHERGADVARALPHTFSARECNGRDARGDPHGRAGGGSELAIHERGAALAALCVAPAE